MKHVTKILSFVLALALLVSLTSVSTYADDVTAHTHKYKKVVTKEATYPSLKYKYVEKCSCGKTSKEKTGTATVSVGTEVTSGSLSLPCTALLPQYTMNQTAVDVKTRKIKIGKKTYSSVQATNGKVYLINRTDFNHVWINPNYGTTYYAGGKALIWQYKTKFQTRNQKKLNGFICTKYSGYSDGVVRIYKYKLSYK